MTKEWQCPYCKQWYSIKYSGCTHAVIQSKFDIISGKKITILGGKPESWTAERKPEYPTR